MKKIAVAFLALFMMATIASAQHGGGHGPGGGPREGFGPGGPALVGSDGTLFIVSGDDASTTIKAISSTGTVAWTSTVAVEGHVIISDGNLIVESDARASDGTVTTTLTAISAASGATAWTKTINGHVHLVPFSGGTYAIVTVPPATSGGSATRSVIGISNSGSTLFTLAL